MQRYFLSKLGQSILLLVGVLVMVFFLLRLTGDPARLMMSREATPEQIATFREEMGFNRPLIVQFWDFATGAVVGDFGKSLHYRTTARHGPACRHGAAHGHDRRHPHRPGGRL
jgi:peptide/nickel transport system permease protein